MKTRDLCRHCLQNEWTLVLIDKIVKHLNSTWLLNLFGKIEKYLKKVIDDAETPKKVPSFPFSTFLVGILSEKQKGAEFFKYFIWNFNRFFQ